MYSNTGDGLKKMFIAEIGMIICTVIAIIPIIGTIIGGIGAIVFAVISLIGLYAAGKEVPGCKTAFIITIANIVVTLLANIPGIKGIASLVSVVLSCLVVLLVCSSISAVLKETGSADIASFGKTVLVLNVIGYVLDFINTLISLIPFIGKIIGGILGVFIGIFMIVAGIFYLIFLYKSSNALS